MLTLHMENSSESTMFFENEEIWELFLPNIIIIGLYIFIGISGNSIVISVYLRKMGQSTDNRLFIPCLAAGDMIACIVCGSSVILLYIFHGEFTNELGCKVMWYCMTWTSSGAALILVFISFQRYKKICTPMKRSKLMNKKFTIICLLYLSSIIVSSPLLFTAGISKKHILNQNVTFFVCERMHDNLRKDWRNNLALIFTGIEAFIVISIATILSSFYTRVGWTLMKHFKSIDGKNETINMHIVENEIESGAASDVSNKSGLDKKNGKSSFKKKNTLHRLLHRKQTFSHKHRYTFIFIAISGICIVTYSPRLVLMIMESVNKNFWVNFYGNKSLFIFLKFLNRLHIVNNIANPLLYAMFDQQFKKQLFNLIGCHSK